MEKKRKKKIKTELHFGPGPEKDVMIVDMDTVKYTDLPNGLFGWHDAKKYFPLECDLVEVKTDNKTVTGWWTGNYWMGLRLKQKDKVKQWKKTSHLNYI